MSVSAWNISRLSLELIPYNTARSCIDQVEELIPDNRAKICIIIMFVLSQGKSGISRHPGQNGHI